MSVWFIAYTRRDFFLWPEFKNASQLRQLHSPSTSSRHRYPSWWNRRGVQYIIWQYRKRLGPRTTRADVPVTAALTRSSWVCCSCSFRMQWGIWGWKFVVWHIPSVWRCRPLFISPTPSSPPTSGMSSWSRRQRPWRCWGWNSVARRRSNS